jgi:hypothetical protein
MNYLPRGGTSTCYPCGADSNFHVEKILRRPIGGVKVRVSVRVRVR